MPEFDSTIVYRDVPGFADFRVGTDGSLWSCRGKSFKPLGSYKCWGRLRPAKSRGKNQPSGYERFSIFRDGVRHYVYLHALMLEVFVCPRPDGMQSCHNDGNPRNNRLDNLRWGTPADNARDKYRHGTILFGEKHPQTLITDAVVAEARKLKRIGMTYTKIRTHLGIRSGNLPAAVRGDTWSHLTAEPPVPDSSLRVYTAEIINECIRLRHAGLSYREIGLRFGVTSTSTSRWVKRWPNGVHYQEQVLSENR